MVDHAPRRSICTNVTARPRCHDNLGPASANSSCRGRNRAPRSGVAYVVRVLALAIVACSSASSTPLPSARATPDPPAAAGAHAPARLGDPHNAGHLVTARAIASVDGGAASERPAYARLDQHVTLYALVQVEDAGRRTWYSDAPAVTLGGRALHVSPLARAPELAITWNRIEPAAAAYSNTDENGGNFHFTQIDYVATEIAGAANRAAIAADVRPTLTEDHGHGVGTMRYQIVVAQGDHTVASAGGEARRGRGSGGLTDDVMRVSIRRDDSYLGYLTEMFGQPYIWASAGITDATHQAERLEGADCADFVVYGMRRLGKKIGYTWTG
ncbi:MAG TPA: hypothetical protein VLX92_00655, partial [Kofleriaceae bacterium]|nr:hypothetical protein [Kofleriaceae bacterium]